MTINFDKAFEVENGIVLSDGSYLTGGSGSPVGFSSPVGTWYLRTDTKTLWYKHNTGVNDWKQISADDVTALDTTVDPAQVETIQFILDKFKTILNNKITQTVIYGNGGNTAQNSYIPNQDVPSNIVGVPVGLTNAKLRSVFLGNENQQTGNVLIQERNPAGTGVWTTIYTLSINNESYKNVAGLTIDVTTGAELAAFTDVSLKNVKVVINIEGDSAA